MNRKQKIRRLIKLCAVADSKKQPIPFFYDMAINREILKLSVKFQKQKTYRSRHNVIRSTS